MANLRKIVDIRPRDDGKCDIKTEDNIWLMGCYPLYVDLPSTLPVEADFRARCTIVIDFDYPPKVEE